MVFKPPKMILTAATSSTALLNFLQINLSEVNTFEWQEHCHSALQWAEHMVPFSQALNAEAEIYGVILSLLVELPTSADTARVFAEHFHDTDDMHPEIQDRVHMILKEWNAIFLNEPMMEKISSGKFPGKTPRGATMSTEFHKRAQKMDIAKRKRVKLFGTYENIVFASEDENEPLTIVGSRPFEHEESYLKFLDTFYAVCFTKLTDEEAQSQSISYPLLAPYVEDIRNQEINSVAYQAAVTLQKKQATASSPRTEKSSRPPSLELIDIENKEIEKPRKTHGLFRSMSWSDLRGGSESPTFGMGKKSSSELNLVSQHSRKVSPRGRPRSSSAEKLGPRRSFSSPDGRTGKPPKRPVYRSVSAIQRQASNESLGKLKNNPLNNLLIPKHVLCSLDFHEEYKRLEELLEWLVRWSSKHHLFGTKFAHQMAETSMALSSNKAAMRINIQPQLIVYCLWLGENKYYSDREEGTENKLGEEMVGHDEIDYNLETINDEEIKMHQLDIVETKNKEIMLEGTASLPQEQDSHIPPPSPRFHSSEPSKKKIKKKKKKIPKDDGYKAGVQEVVNREDYDHVGDLDPVRMSARSAGTEDDLTHVTEVMTDRPGSQNMGIIDRPGSRRRRTSSRSTEFRSVFMICSVFQIEIFFSSLTL